MQHKLISFTLIPFESTLSIEMMPPLFGRVLEWRKSDTWSKASLEGVDTHPFNTSTAPIESGLNPGPW